MQKKSKPIAVLISDVHFSLKTLNEASQSMKMAISKANELDIPLIVAGDLHDTKANIRGECMNAMLRVFECRNFDSLTYVLRGNHDALHEKSAEHSIGFLEHEYNSYAIRHIVTEPESHDFGFLIPYYHDVNELRAYLKTLPKGSTLIMHQGLVGSDSGEYYQDPSALNPEDVADFRVISGHYHRRQDIKTGRPQQGAVGLWSFIGNPYSLNFLEADHPDKGFQILYDDGLLEFVPTNLRRHVVNILRVGPNGTTYEGPVPNANDLVWVKVHAPSDIMHQYTKDAVQKILGKNVDSLRLELIPSDEITAEQKHEKLDFDSVIDAVSPLSADRKTRLKSLWKELVCRT